MGLSINLITISSTSKGKKSVLSPQATPKRFNYNIYNVSEDVNNNVRYVINKLVDYHYINKYIEYNEEQDILDIKAYIKSNNYQIYNEELREFLKK